MELRDEIQQIALQHRHYGYRRVTAELRRQGHAVNHKRVARLMRLDNLLAVRRQPFRPLTTDSRHPLAIYLNLASRLTLSGPNQLWIADITYIRLQREFVYLAVVLDAWSRKVVGWRLSRCLQSEVAVEALQEAITTRQPPRGLVHHSDRGVQYASSSYQQLLEHNGLLPSMSRAGNPYDNATCESFMKTLKTEQVDGRHYTTLEELQNQLSAFVDTYYNEHRLHSSLGYRSPAEFEQTLPPGAPQAAVLEFS